MKTKPLLLVLFVFFINTTFAQKFYGGEIIARQTATYGAEAIVEFFTAAEDDISSIELCWGDGICDEISPLFTEAYPESGLRYYRFGASHIYGYEDTFTLSVLQCCWASDILNFNSSNPTSFLLTTQYFHSVEDILFGENRMPDYDLGLLFGNALQPLRHETNLVDSENDNIHVAVCGVENIPAFTEITSVYPNPGNVLFLDSLNGDFQWFSPPVAGKYMLALCFTESRNGTVISEHTRYFALSIDEPVSNQDLFENDQIKISPNPANEQLQIELPTTSSDFELRVFDAQGKRILTGHKEMTLAVQDWNPGLYTLFIQMDGQLYSKRFVVH